jgi:hypothetical protein
MLVVRARRDEDDRHLLRALGAAHQLSELETVHVRHVHVEQRQGNIVRQQQLESLAARARAQNIHIVPLQQCGQRE